MSFQKGLVALALASACGLAGAFVAFASGKLKAQAVDSQALMCAAYVCLGIVALFVVIAKSSANQTWSQIWPDIARMLQTAIALLILEQLAGLIAPRGFLATAVLFIVAGLLSTIVLYVIYDPPLDAKE